MPNDRKVHVTWHEHTIDRAARESLSGHRGCVVWFTGLSGSGKSTVANLVDHQLHTLGVHSFVLDGDNVRHGLNSSPEALAERYGKDFANRFGLGFEKEDREENIRRIGAVAALFCEAGLVTLTAFVSPYRADRDAIREQLAPSDFVEVFVDAPLSVCEARDPKGLYRKARAGQIANFTGISDPYESPKSPELILNAAAKNAVTLADEVVLHLRSVGTIA